MATGKPPQRAGRRKLLRLALPLVVLMGAGGAWLGWSLKAQAVAGAAYGARIGCSCRYVAGRLLSECRKDFEPGMAMVMLSEDEAAKSVTAKVPMLASDTARFVPGAGCRLDGWKR